MITDTTAELSVGLGTSSQHSCRFDRKAAETAALPEGADVFKPFDDAIDEIIALILNVR